MAEFITKCPHCGGELQVQDEWIGMDLECPLCKKHFTLSAETPECDQEEVSSDYTEDCDDYDDYDDYGEDDDDDREKRSAISWELIGRLVIVIVVLVYFIISCNNSKTDSGASQTNSEASKNEHAELEKNAVLVVNDILGSNKDVARCLSVTVRSYINNAACYKADAKLDDGRTLQLTITDRYASIEVYVDNYVEESAVSIVNDIIKDRTDAKCVSVKIVEPVHSSKYKAEAKLDDGSILNISISVLGKIVEVTVNE